MDGNIDVLDSDITDIKEQIESLMEFGGTSVPFIPDYTAIRPDNVIDTDDTTWTADDDGFVYVETGAQSIDTGWLRLNVWINDVRVSKNLSFSVLSDGNRIRVSDLLPIGKGDTIRVRVWRFDPRIEGFYVMARFIPPRAVAVPTADSVLSVNEIKPIGGNVALTAFDIPYSTVEYDMTVRPAPPGLPRTHSWRVEMTGNIIGEYNYRRFFYSNTNDQQLDVPGSPNISAAVMAWVIDGKQSYFEYWQDGVIVDTVIFARCNATPRSMFSFFDLYITQ